jgi:hypothetical protein
MIILEEPGNHIKRGDGRGRVLGGILSQALETVGVDFERGRIIVPPTVAQTGILQAVGRIIIPI